MDKVKEELLAKGLKSESFLILDSFLDAENIIDLESLLVQSDIGKKGLDELRFVMDNIAKLELDSANFIFDITLARGLDYYTGCIFEVKQKRFVVTNSKKTALGFVDIFDFEPLHRRAGVGIILKKEYRGLGYGRKAIKLLEKYMKKFNVGTR